MCFDVDARPPLPPIRGGALDARNLTLTSQDGTAVVAYAARAEAPSGAGIVVVPDVRGLHPFYEELVLRFAEAGVDAAGVDLYGRTAESPARGDDFEYEPHVLQLTVDGVNGDIAAAVDHLRSADGGAPARLYTVGFCMGGRISLLQAAAGLGLAGVISLYGIPVGAHRSGMPAPADLAPRFACPVLALYGGADAAIPGSSRDEFDRALDAASIEHRTRVYADAPHSFFDRKAHDFADASADAWLEILTFMKVPITA
jgi:carboxymethylenebutenolidase